MPFEISELKAPLSNNRKGTLVTFSEKNVSASQIEKIIADVAIILIQLNNEHGFTNRNVYVNHDTLLAPFLNAYTELNFPELFVIFEADFHQGVLEASYSLFPPPENFKKPLSKLVKIFSGRFLK